MILKSENPVEWAIQAARQDAMYLISPRARQAAIDILWPKPATKEALAALTILRDGGSQQELHPPKYAKNADLRDWSRAAETLEAI